MNLTNNVNKKGIELIRKFKFSTPELVLHLIADHDIGKMAKIHEDEYYRDELVENYTKHNGDLDKFAKHSVKAVHDLIKEIKDVELELLKKFKDNEHVYNGKSGAPYEKDKKTIVDKFERIEQMVDTDLYNLCLALESLENKR